MRRNFVQKPLVPQTKFRLGAPENLFQQNDFVYETCFGDEISSKTVSKIDEISIANLSNCASFRQKSMGKQTKCDTIFRLLGGVTAGVRSYEILRKNRRTGIKKNDIRRWIARTAFRRKTVRQRTNRAMPEVGIMIKNGRHASSKTIRKTAT